MKLLAHKQVLSKKSILVFAFSIIALFALSGSVMAGCCVFNNYNTIVPMPTEQECYETYASESPYFFEADCNSPALSYYVDKMCCMINLSDNNYCYYSSIARAYELAASEYSVGADKVSCFSGDFGSDGTSGCINNTQGGCPSPEPTPNCSAGCIQAGSSPLFCTAQGSIVSDCAYCLDNDCGGLSCNAETGICENTEPVGCAALGGTFSCCAECDPDYSSNSSFDYSSANADSCSLNNQKCCEKCASQLYCCKYSAQCSAYDVANNPSCQSTETGCSVACEQWKCNLQAAIKSNSDYPVPSVCWCGGIERNTATDTGYCCASSDPNGQYSESSCDAALGFSVSGTVFDADTKQPISNAIVIVDEEGMASGKTSSDGRYALAFSVDKEYALSAYAPNYYLATKTADVSSLPLELNFSLQSRVSSNCTPESPSRITGFNATHDVQGRVDIRLFWEQKCQNLISAYYIKRNDSAQRVIPSSLGYYIDNENLKWNTSYRYEIWAVYKSGGSSPRAAIVFRTGDALCEGIYAGDEFCGKIVSGKIQKNVENSNLRLKCTALNSVSTSVDINGKDGYYRQNCSEYSTARLCSLSRASSSDNVLSRCILSNACEGSGNPFGLFYSENSCSAITDASCFFDFSRTTVDSCNSCRADLRCSEFSSQNACAENTCGLNCTWQYTNSELEKGICYSEGQSGTGYCDECNSIFMGCDDAACGNLGSCMLTDGLCSSCPADIICANYTSQEACSGHISEKKFEVCIEGQRIFRSNNDACKMLKCAWTGTQCVKDGNYDSADDCSVFSDPDAISDCANDNSPPITSVSGFGYSPLEGAYFNFSMNEPVVKISYCLDRTDTCCPDAQQQIDNKNAFSIRIREGISDSGMYYLRFSSVDKFGNQEGIKSVPVIVSGSTLSATIKHYFTDASRYNLTVIVQVDDGMSATCTFDISGDAKGKVSRSNFGRENSSFEVYFAGLDYANYLFFLNCTKDGAEYTVYQPMIKESSSKFRITVVTPYTRLALPAVGRGSYNVLMNFSEPVTITYLNYELLDGSFANPINPAAESADRKNWNFTMEIPEDPGLLSEITKEAKISVSAQTDSGDSLTESDANSPYFIIDTRAPEIVIVIE